MKQIISLCLLTLLALPLAAQPRGEKPKRHNPLREKRSEFFRTDEARRIGDQVLMWQRVTGGWPKNVDMASPMTEAQRQQVVADKQRRDDSTTDNNATTMQMSFLARLFQATGDERYAEGFHRGLAYLLSGQYDNGGWPQFWPGPSGYQVHITFNDDAMVNTMRMLRAVYEEQKPYQGALCDKKLENKAKKAFKRGIDCILKTQIVVNGRPTVWCQQHDRETFLPAKARAYELPSYCTQESAALVELLMSLPKPNKRVKQAIHGAMAWLDSHKLTGYRYERIHVGDHKFRASLTPDPQAKGPIWARFYDLDEERPFVCDRDGVPKRSLDEIGEERRNGYAWYNTRPAELYPLYEKWADKYDPEHKLTLHL